MLRSLAISHLAVIDTLELEFEPGFTAITGETGAGKSILINALGLVLGDRADLSLIAQDQPHAEVTATFELHSAAEQARAWLNDQALDDGDLLIVRRMLSRQSSSRAWINGRPATIGQLAELGRCLVEIHGQHEHQRLGESEVQRQLLDQRVPEDLLTRTRETFQAWQAIEQQLLELQRQSGDAAELDLLGYQVRELEQLALAEGEFECLKREQEQLSRSDEIRAAVATILSVLESEQQPGARSLLNQAIGQLERLGEVSPTLAEVRVLLGDARIQVEEALSALERFDPEAEADPKRLEEINQRLQTASDLARKHRIEPDALPTVQRRLRDRLDRLVHHDSHRSELERTLAQCRSAWQTAASALSQARIQAAEALAGEVTEHLAALGMTHAQLHFEFSVRDEPPQAHGADRVCIMFSANPGQRPSALSRVASGGELSRISLALTIAAQPDRAPPVRVFDEVDAGIGGETAAVVGRFLKRAAAGGQAFCVTHLARVAACAQHQIKVDKQAADGVTKIRALALDPQQRPAEIARMLGGGQSRKSLDHASEMLRASA